MNFLYYESKFKMKRKKIFGVCVCVGGGGGGGGGAGGGGGGRWIDRQTGPNQLPPSTSSKLGHKNT